MNRAEYITELAQRLKALPLTREDAGDAIQYYEEYFDEAGPEQEQAVINELGSPAYVAAQIALKLSASPTPLTEKKHGLRNQASMFKIVLLGILAAPVALPLAACVAAVIFSLLITAAAIVFSFGGGGIICMISGVMVAAYAATTIWVDFATAIYFIGSGLVALGIGGLLTKLGWNIGKFFIRLVNRIITRFFGRNKTAGAERVYQANQATQQEGNNHA